MTNEGFKAWRTAMGLSQAAAAEVLGMSKAAIENYDRGVRRDTGEPVVIPHSVALACAAVYHRIEAWSDGDRRVIDAGRA